MNPQEVLEALSAGKIIGATLHYPQDKYGYVVVGSTKSGKTVQVVALTTPDIQTGHHVARWHGIFPVWDHTYTDAELSSMKSSGDALAVRWSERRQGWRLQGSVPFSVGSARYYRDHSY